MADDYGYINARVKVMRTQLIEGRRLEAALEASSYPEFLRVLSESNLAADLGEATAENAGLAELDAALSRNFFKTSNKVLQLADGSAREEVSVLLQKWDLINLKTLARGLISGRSTDEISSSLVPGGSLRPSALSAAASSNELASAQQAIGITGHPLAQAFRDAVAAYQQTGRLLDLELTLDQGYYRRALQIARGSGLRRYLAREIDLTNALTARALGSQDPALQVPNGAGSEVSAILDAPSLEEAESQARVLQDEAARNAAMSDPLGVGVVIDFLRRKEQEIAKLRLIGRGKFYAMPSEQLRKEVGVA